MRTALVVDDDTGFRERLAADLRARGIRVLLAADLTRARELLDGEAPDGVVFEPNLPGSHWCRVLTELSGCMGSGRWVAITAFPSRALDEWASRTGVVGPLSKPVAPADVHRVLAGDFDPPRPDHWPGRLMSLARAEWEYLNSALAECEGNVSVAARRLAIPRQTLYRKLRTHPPPA